MTEAVRPKFVVPIHGEYRMLFRHKEFVKNHLGYSEDNIILIENGDVLELDGERAAVIDKREIGRTFIDESGFKEIDSETVRERKQLAYEGTVTVVVAVIHSDRRIICSKTPNALWLRQYRVRRDKRFPMKRS
jgi:ribonuclease J